MRWAQRGGEVPLAQAALHRLGSEQRRSVRAVDGPAPPPPRLARAVQGRGPQGAKSPLLWPEGQVEELLQGSPVKKEIAERLKVSACGLWVGGLGEGGVGGSAPVGPAWRARVPSCLPTQATPAHLPPHYHPSPQGIRKEYEELDAVWFLAGRWVGG